MTCPALETIAAWVLGELPALAAEPFEEHLFGCVACTRNAERRERLVAQVAGALPYVLTPERRRGLALRHPRLVVVDVEPGQRGMLRLGKATSLGVWVLHVPLDAATRVDLEASAADGSALLSLPDVPFDAARGEVLLACHLHYGALPGGSEMFVRLTATRTDGERPVGEYVLDHEFENL